MQIDSEVHFWKYDRENPGPYPKGDKLLAQHYLPEQLTQSLHRNGIQGCIAVVADNQEVETRFLAELAFTHPEILGVVGWMDLYHRLAEDKMRELRQYTPIKGFQITVDLNTEPTAAVMDLLLVYQYCLEISISPATDITALSRWLQNNPEQHFILRHCGNPDTRRPATEEWKNQIRILAKHKNLSCKVSGLLTAARGKSWKPADFYPFLELVFEAFGPDRVLFASEWPYLLLAGIYVQWKSLLEKFTEKFAEEDRKLFFGENAMRLYKL